MAKQDNNENVLRLPVDAQSNIVIIVTETLKLVTSSVRSRELTADSFKMGFKRVLLDRVRIDSVNVNDSIPYPPAGSHRTITNFSIDNILNGQYSNRNDRANLHSDNYNNNPGKKDNSNLLCNFKFISESMFLNKYEVDPSNVPNHHSRYQPSSQGQWTKEFYSFDMINNKDHFEKFKGKNNSNLLEQSKISGSFSVFIQNDTLSPSSSTSTCQTCEKVFETPETLDVHLKTHRTSRYDCSICGKAFSQLRNYKYHLSVHNGTREFAAECSECGKVFNDKGYLSSHMKIHRNRKEYACPHCPKSFNQRVAFNMHVRIHTGVKPHKCAECGKRFSRKMLLKQHMRTHSGEKPYECSVCGKSFADRSNMTLHQRLHSGVKPFSCPICPKAFTKKHHLKTHLNYHTGYKPYRCPFSNCGQLFTQSSNMRTHSKKCQFRT